MFLAVAPTSPEASRLFEADLHDDGYVMNLSRLCAWRPELCEAFSA